MHILFITNYLPPVIDGVGDYTYNLAREFSKRGHEVTIVCRADLEIDADIPGVAIYPVIKKWDNSAATSIVRVIQDRDIRVVCLQYVPHGFHPKGLPFGLPQVVKAIKGQGVTLFTFCHEVCVSLERWNLKRTLLSYLMQGITHRILNASDLVATSIGHYAWMIWKLTGRTGIPLIPIPSNIPPCTLTEEQIRTLKNQIAPNGEFIVGFIGRRQVDGWVRVIDELGQQGKSIRILAIGKTNFTGLQPTSGIYVTGPLPITDMAGYLQAADCIVLPEPRDSGCSFKSGSLVAAMREGKAVITNKGFMTDERLENGKNILFVDPDRPASYQAALTRLVDFPEERKTIGEHAKRLTENFTWQETYRKYMECLRKS